MKRIITTLIFCLFLAACEIKKFDVDTNSGARVGESDAFFSDESFDGIDRIALVTDSTATLYWNNSSAAVEYEIYMVDGDTENLLKRVKAPSTETFIGKLDSGVEYTFKVRLRDENNRLDDNDTEISITTLAAPAPPTYLILSTPEKTTDAIVTAEVKVFGVNVGDEVSLYTDSACATTAVASGKATDTYIILKSSALASDVDYNFYGKRTNHNGIESVCSTAFANYNLKSCPAGYALVPAKPPLGVPAFCVMEYEARAWVDINSDNLVYSLEVDSDGCYESACTTKNWGLNTYVPGSTSEGMPWRMLSIENAKERCQALGDGYDLISNIEWMAIAEDIEAQAANWSGGIVGSPADCILRGNIGMTDDCSYSKGAIDSGSARDTKAKLVLSNGSSLWDFSGNVAEWVDYGQKDMITLGPNYCHDSWSEYFSEYLCADQLFGMDNAFMPRNPTAIFPASNYTSQNGLGMFEGGTGGAMLRGGAYKYGTYAGIYSLSLNQNATTAREDIGFRCVWRRQ